MLAGLLVPIAIALFANAQDLNNLPLSQPCKGALIAAVNNPQLSPCLNILGAISVATTAQNSSLVPSLNNWITGFCGAKPCDPVLLNQASSNITTGCATDIASTGASASVVAGVLNQIVGQYDLIRSVACLQITTDKKFCLSELLGNIEQGIGEPLSINTLLDLPNAIISGEVNSRTIPKSAYCTDCVRGAWAIVKQENNSIGSNQAINNALSNQCGMDFAAATAIPTGIAEVTGSAAFAAATTTASSAMRLTASLPVGGMVASFVAMGVSVVAGVSLFV